MIGDENYCFLCGTPLNLQEHHCLSGSYRKAAEKYGLKVKVCANCHTLNTDSIHHEPSQRTKKIIEKIGQIYAMEHYGWTVEEFIRNVGKNFL